MLLIPVPKLPSQQVYQQLQSKETLVLSPQLQAWHQHYVSVGHTNMGICEKPNLVLKIFASFSSLTKYDTLLPFVPQLFMHKMHKDFSPRFHRSRTESFVQEIGIPALHMHPCSKRKKWTLSLSEWNSHALKNFYPKDLCCQTLLLSYLAFENEMFIFTANELLTKDLFTVPDPLFDFWLGLGQ